MVSRENTNWLFDYGLIDDIPVPDASFTVPSSAFTWPPNALNTTSNVGYMQIDSPIAFFLLTLSFLCYLILPLDVIRVSALLFDWFDSVNV